MHEEKVRIYTQSNPPPRLALLHTQKSHRRPWKPVPRYTSPHGSHSNRLLFVSQWNLSLHGNRLHRSQSERVCGSVYFLFLCTGMMSRHLHPQTPPTSACPGATAATERLLPPAQVTQVNVDVGTFCTSVTEGGMFGGRGEPRGEASSPPAPTSSERQRHTHTQQECLSADQQQVCGGLRRSPSRSQRSKQKRR